MYLVNLIKKLLVVINEFSKVAGYKIGIQKAINISENLEWTIQKWNQENNSVYNSIKVMKHIGINLTKNPQNLNCGNYKTLLKETKDDLNK